MTNKNIERIDELVEILNKASIDYYENDNSKMSDKEYDKLYDELVILEKEENYIKENSPTINVGSTLESNSSHKIIKKLVKVTHNEKMLSLDKTKDVQKLVSFLDDKEGLLSFKMDGLTVILTYENGILTKGVTRGNGKIGEDITHNVEVFKNVPKTIPDNQNLIVRGEAVITFSSFEKINERLDIENKYKNPRNLASGTVRSLDNSVVSDREVYFYAFSLINYQDFSIDDKKTNAYTFLEKIGFNVVPHKITNRYEIEKDVIEFEKKVLELPFGTDGLVLTYNSYSYSLSLGQTAKFPRHSIAFKWEDEEEETTLLDVVWNTSRTGVITPVAVFKEIDLIGTIVSRASLHNVSIIEELELGIGDTIKVYKANMIIPQISENLTRSNTLVIPTVCPACGEKAEILTLSTQKALYCTNDNCSAKILDRLVHFVGRGRMNIEGLSEQTLEKFVNDGYIKDFSDIFHLYKYKDEIISKDGFGEKSYNNLMASIENSKTVPLPNFIFALGINQVGGANAMLLVNGLNAKDDVYKIINAKYDDILAIDGFGDVIANSVVSYFRNEDNLLVIKKLLEVITFEKPIEVLDKLKGQTFVITGSLFIFKNRDELVEKITNLGGKVGSSVSKNTSYLINNDIESTSSKNKKANDLNIPIITEEQFLQMLITEN